MLEDARLRIPAVAAGALALAVAGCGGSSYSGSSSKKSSGKTNSAPAPAAQSGGSGQKVKLEADEDGGLYFKPKKLKAKAGAVTLVMTNPKTTKIMHGIAVKGNGIDQDGPIVQPGGTATVTATLKPGRYTFYCNFDSHAKKGMKGTLTVQ